MPNFVRIKHKTTGTEYTVSADIAIGSDAEVIDKPAVDDAGKPLPPKYKSPVLAPNSEPDNPTDKGQKATSK